MGLGSFNDVSSGQHVVSIRLWSSQLFCFPERSGVTCPRSHTQLFNQDWASPEPYFTQLFLPHHDASKGIDRVWLPVGCDLGALCVQSLSLVRLFGTPWTVTHQAPLSMEFSRQEYWSGLPFPSLGDLPDPEIELRYPALQVDFFYPLSHLGIPKTNIRKRELSKECEQQGK